MRGGQLCVATHNWVLAGRWSKEGSGFFSGDAGRDRILCGLGAAVRAAPVEASPAEANGWRDWGERKNARQAQPPANPVS
ncbi:MAG: hypothetical protein RL077_2337 [Verrucomicrobiota bacterium]|jgi:hypothetical protein